ncbi:tigger transposable element-derived protein 4-like [Belonocnema kinseyi]|uniref:tigger transposable element-derived protein 4-like n=1 Tax=Belonocnema kinseyi TaxID=2817044 RepID=UPI00143D8043|nr:tigger transposable element-derived protein 4-like [Belonocnema kinseyi]
MTGIEKLKLVVIGKSQKPRCFKKRKVESLPVTYTNNKKAWMTSAVYESWIFDLDKKISNQKRKVLLFVDNCLVHPKILSHELKEIRVVFLPPNITSKLQPMDQGIIKNAKYYYWRSVMRRNLRNLESGKEMNNVNLLNAIEMLYKVVDETVVEESPPECFRYQKLFSVTYAIEFQNFVNVDSDIITTSYPTDIEMLNSTKFQEESNDLSEEEADSDDDVESSPNNLSQATDELKILRKYIREQPGTTDEIF